MSSYNISLFFPKLQNVLSLLIFLSHCNFLFNYALIVLTSLKIWNLKPDEMSTFILTVIILILNVEHILLLNSDLITNTIFILSISLWCAETKFIWIFPFCPTSMKISYLFSYMLLLFDSLQLIRYISFVSKYAKMNFAIRKIFLPSKLLFESVHNCFYCNAMNIYFKMLKQMN